MGLSYGIADRVASVILAGGQGTRLFPLTQTRCKPAVSFGGRYRLIDIPLSNSLNSHIGQLFVISQYFASDLQQHIQATYHYDLFGLGKIEMLCPEETPQGKNWFKGTADAVRQNLRHLLKASADYFLILSGDQLYNIDLLRMINFVQEKKVDFVIAALTVPTKEAKRMGLLKIDSSSCIEDFVEKPSDPQVLSTFQFQKPDQFLGSMGIYVFKREALVKALEEEKGDDFGRDIIPPQVKKRKAAAFIYDGYWEDIGTIASYYEANLALTANKCSLNMYDETHPIFTCPYKLPSPIIRDTIIKDSIIGQGSIIGAQEIIHSIVGIRAHIESGTVIRNSIILGNHFYNPPSSHQQLAFPSSFTIGKDCLIEKAIIDEHTLIGNGVQLLNREGRNKYDGDGVYIRDGIIIVTSNTRLPDGFIL